ncbi:MAG TPA: lamin tail domain-containing protein [Candidatus Krumholzibacteria bacterium]|nr:lamin tail domain-containing protein [Candidatus Krumholzibacteria bacterium]
MTPPAFARVVINELYYDHPGADAGYEYVELFETAGDSVDISGLTVEFHNGSGDGWTVLWRADAAAWTRTGGLFVVGADAVQPAPDAVFGLSLQNGPDAIRIVSADGSVLDVVGYGGLDDPAYTEIRGAPPLPAGTALARIPDGHDTGDNAADFVPSLPSPGRFNVPRDDVTLRLAPGGATIAARDTPGAETITFDVANTGTRVVAAGAVTISIVDSTGTGSARAVERANLSSIAPGDSERVALSLSLERGYHWLQARASYAPDERAGNDTLRLLRRVGGIPVLVSEVWSAPRDGCPQFVELYNAGSQAVDVGGWSLRDSRAQPVGFASDSLVIGARAFLAIAASPSALLACVPGTPRAGVAGVDGSWPAFNRAGSDAADSVVVFDRYGVVVDAVAYPGLASGVSGRSLERVDLYAGSAGAVWRLSPAVAGCTPGLPNEASLYDKPPGGELSLAPNPFAPARGELLRIAVDAGPAVVRAVVSVFDARGRRVADVGSAAAFPAVFLWDGRDVAGAPVRSGIYVVACEELLADGSRGVVLKAVVGCANGSP